MTSSKALALTLALAVHLLTLGFVVAGIALVVAGWPRFFLVMGGLICLSVAWFLRPRPAEMPSDVLPRETFPALYAFVDEIAKALDAPAPYGIVITEEFNASFGQAGWQRRRILYLGLPLFTILDEQEKVALVAHELAHGINGDLARGFVVGSAIHSLERLYALIRPDDDWDGETGFGSTLLLPFNILMLGFARLPWLVAYTLSHLLWRNGQRAEYLADYLATTASGTPSMRSMLDKLHLSHTFWAAVQASALGSQGRRPLLTELRERITHLPEHERERVRRVERMEQSRLDRTHPPTVYRIAFLEAHPVAEGRIVATQTDVERLDRELATCEDRVEMALIDQYRRHLYY